MWKHCTTCQINKNNLYLPQANLTIYQKGNYYLGINIFNNLPKEIKNVTCNLKSSKLLCNNSYTLTHFVHWNSTLTKHELCTLSQKSLLYWYFEGLSMYIIYVFIDCPLCISIHCINMMSYLCIVFIQLLLLLFVSYCQDSFSTVPIVLLITSSLSTLMDLWNTE
jgi:hypothetical protein